MSADRRPVEMIQTLLGSEVCNYLESGERLHLNTYLQKIESGPLDGKELEVLEKIFRKYKKYLD